MSDAEVLVVGAGPAGATAAFHLARRGRRVTLLEARREGEAAKPCGGGMASSVQRWFPFDLRPAVDGVIRQVRFTWCLDDPVTADLPGEAPFWIVRRSVLDAFLRDRAAEAGARLLTGHRVEQVQRDAQRWRLRLAGGEQLESRALVIADGSSSPFATALGLGPPQPRFADTVSLEVDAAVEAVATARFEFGLVRHGFCWCFPRLGGYSIGVGTFVGRQAADADAVLKQLLPSLGLDPAAGLRRPGRLRLWNGHHPLHGAGVVVVGDAASLCDPFLAEGLRPSLMSGHHAGEALDRWLAGEAGALADYSRTMRRDWGESMAWGRRIAQVFYRLPRVGYQLGIKRPTAPRRIAQILSGEMGYGDIAQRAIRRLTLRQG